ncbi:MAG: hypothetical protein ACYTFA_12040 [Planctomycetota bacterium]
MKKGTGSELIPDDPTFAPGCIAAIPTISSWGVIILTLLLLAGGKLCYGRCRRGVPHRGEGQS